MSIVKKKCNVVMLPTEDKSNLCIAGNIPVYITESSYNLSHIKSQHLYVIVSQDKEPIKQGDFVIVSNNLYYYNPHNKENHTGVSSISILLPEDRKIIATTDPKLKIAVCGNCKQSKCYDKHLICESLLPHLQQCFLKDYVANPDGEWEIEYEENYDIRYYTPAGGIECAEKYNEKTVLKLNQDNTVNITSVNNTLKQKLIKHLEFNHIEASENRIKVIMKFIESTISVEEKMYSKEEVRQLIYSAVNENMFIIECEEDGHGYIDENLLNEFIKKNL